MKPGAAISENRFLGSISTSSIRNLLPKKHKGDSMRTKSRSDIENTPPIDRNIPAVKSEALTPTINKAPSYKETPRSASRQELPPPADPAVKVVVRIRPVNDHERQGDWTVRKVSSDSLLVGDRRFTFDSVLDSNSTQDDVFQLVGIPLVKSALAGFNTSILSYGQTGSGKTYTMWGPPSAMVDGNSSSGHQGIVPRVFQMLFSEIQREQDNSEGKHINYQCRCSFLEIYNEKIGDLIDPTHRDLEIKDDAKNGFYVEKLTEDYVTSFEDVLQILIKGLSSRKVGATSINSKSSRSHVVFTCIIESWRKGNSSTCFSSSKTSRITLVDLAGLDRTRFDDASSQHTKEGKNVKKSLSQLGHVVNVLAEGTQSGRLENVPYKNSCLTHLLRESLGGNAKLAVICGIASDNRSTGETLSTLRFGQRAKAIHNLPVINEITEDDVNDLSDQIRQLKEELIRAKSSHSISSSGYFQGRSVRDSLNQLRVRLNRSLILPSIDNDSEEEIKFDEADVKELRMQLDTLQSSFQENSADPLGKRSRIKQEESCEMNLMSEHDLSCLEESDLVEQGNLEVSDSELPPMEDDSSAGSFPSTTDAKFNGSLSITSCRNSDVLQDPPLSESPKFGTTQRKSTTLSSNFRASQKDISESSKLTSNVLRNSLIQNDLIHSVQSSKSVPGPTESLAASLQRGLQIIDYHQQQAMPNKSSVSFSFGRLTLKPSSEVDKANASSQTLSEEIPSNRPSASFLCASCRQRGIDGTDEVEDSLKKWTVSADEAQNQMGAGKEMAEVMKRADLEQVCMEQAAKIEELNHLVEQYRRENEQNSSISKHSQEIVPFEELKSDERCSIKNESKLLGCNYEEDQPEIIKEKCEIKEVLEGVNPVYRDTSSKSNEKEALLMEIQSLRSKLQSNADIYPNKSVEKLRSSLISRSIQLQKSVADFQANSEEELEKERQRWTEMESDWISLTDELRIDLESHRRHAEKVEMELRLEKKCTEELDDVLQRAVLGHARMVEHYAELQEKHNEVVEKQRVMMEGMAEVKRAAEKAGAKGHGPRFAKALAAELSALRLERERECKQLKKENKSLRIQLKDTAEAVHAAGELLVRLREAEAAAAVAEENYTRGQEENEKLKKQLEKVKRKHKMEMITMKQYLAESRLPESALQPLYREDSDSANKTAVSAAYDDQAWKAEFGAIYQDHY